MVRGSKVTTRVRTVSATQKSFQKPAGFGFIETFVSIILLAGFLLSACHLLLNLFSSKLLDQSASKFVNTFQFARQAAIESNSKVMVRAVANNWSKGWEVYAIPSSSISGQKAVSEQSQLLLKQIELEEVISVSSDDQLTIVFNPNGMTTNLSPLGRTGLTLCNANGKGRQLTMLASGQVQVKEINQGCGVS